MTGGMFLNDKTMRAFALALVRHFAAIGSGVCAGSRLAAYSRRLLSRSRFLRFRGQRLKLRRRTGGECFRKRRRQFLFQLQNRFEKIAQFLMRFTAAFGVKKSDFASLRFTARANSSHVTGMEMNGSAPFARIA